MDDGVVAFALELVFVFAMLLLRFSLRLFAFRLLLFALAPRLANATSITIKPTPITTAAASPPNIHQTALDFFCCTGGGVGLHCGCCGCGGGGGGGGAPVSDSRAEPDDRSRSVEVRTYLSDQDT